MNPQDVITQAINSSLSKHLPARPVVKTAPAVAPRTTSKSTLKESVIASVKPYTLKTESLSSETKELHTNIYKEHVESFNTVSTQLDVVNRQDTSKPSHSAFKSLKMDETDCLNGVKLHELYFSNISDPNSMIRVDSLPFMRLSRDWGTFENWQFDFRACGMVANEGWVVCYYEPYKQRYMNVVIEGDALNVPLCCIPVIIIDTHHHAWFLDFPGDKMTYLDTMMRELHWSVIEARMAVAEKANLQNLYAIQPVVNAEPEKMVGMLPSNQPPISKDQMVNNTERLSTNGQGNAPTQAVPQPGDQNPRAV